MFSFKEGIQCYLYDLRNNGYIFKRGFIPVSQFRVYEGAQQLWKIVVHVCSLVVSRDSFTIQVI